MLLKEHANDQQQNSKDPFKRTTTPNFKKSYNSENQKNNDDDLPKFGQIGNIENERNNDKTNKKDNYNDNKIQLQKKLIKEPTFSKNIIGQSFLKSAPNQKSQKRELEEKYENDDAENKDLIKSPLLSKESQKNIKIEEQNNSSQKKNKVSASNSKQISVQSSTSQIPSQKDIKTFFSQKVVNTESDKDKSLEKINEKCESELSSPEKKSPSKANVFVSNIIKSSPPKQTLNTEVIRDIIKPLEIKTVQNIKQTNASNNFKTNLIDLFRSEIAPINNNKSSKRSLLGTLALKEETTKLTSSKLIHINPNENLISMFKNEIDSQQCLLNIGEDDNHNLVTIGNDGPSPINCIPNDINEVENDRELSLNISALNESMNNSNIEKSDIRTTTNNIEDISKDYSKYSYYGDIVKVEYDEKKGLFDHSPSNNSNILAALNSPNNQSKPEKKNFGFPASKPKSRNNIPSGSNEEKNFLSPSITKKQIPTTTAERFKNRSLTLNEIDESNQQQPIRSPQNIIKKPVPISPVSSNKPSKSLQRAKTAFDPDNSVVHTARLDITKDEQGNKKINNYLLIKDLGRGGFGKVKLALNETDKKHYAIKISNKKKLKRKLLSRTTSVYTLLEKEVATMKKLNHPNIVKLFEVIDDEGADKLYLVMEYMKKGAILSKSYFKFEQTGNKDDIGFNEALQLQEQEEKKTLTFDKAKQYFRDFLLGLDYLHNYANVIHRDLKPENLLIDENDVLKIADFGVSTIMENGNDQLSNNAGTKAFLAPETWDGKPFQGKKADVWACASTLFYLLIGKLLFFASNADDLKKKIQEENPEFPANFPESIKDLILKGLEKNPSKRITIAGMMNHPWVTDNGLFNLENLTQDDEIFEVCENEIKAAFTKITFRATIMLSLKLKKTLTGARSRILQKKNSNASICSQLSEKNE